MLQKRFGQNNEGELDDSAAQFETARAAADSYGSKTPEKSGDERISLFWRVFGGTLLSMIALGAITLFNNISSNIAELRNELSREREARAELVKKDEFNSRTTSQYERMRVLENLKADYEGLKERVNNNAVTLENVRKETAAGLDGIRKDFAGSADAMKKDATALEVVKDRVSSLESLKKDLAGIDVLKDRFTTAAADLKALRDEVAKLQQESERNKAGDLERKILRDAQYKQFEDSLKELQKGLQVCREKLARWEGSQPAAPSRGGALIPFDPPAAKTTTPPVDPGKPGPDED